MLYFTIEKRHQDGIGKVTEAAGARWRFYPRISSDIVGYRRIILESSFYWRKHFRELPMKSWASRFRGRGSIWWGWRVTLVAPRIGNDVSYVPQIAGDIDFAWQGQHLVRLDANCTCSVHWKWRFICDADGRWHWFCVAGAVFAELGRWLAGDFSWQAQHFVTFWEIAGPRNVVFYNRKASPRWDREGHRSGGCEMTILSSDIVGYRRIILESSFYWRKHFREFPMKSWASRFRGRRSIWWGWRVTLVAPRIGNEVAYVTQIIDDIHFAWQAQYLVRLEGGFTCSAHWKWGFICDADHWWHSFCVAGAVFGEVGGWLHLLHALEMRFHIMWRRSLMTFILRGRRSIWWGWRVTSLAPRIGNAVSYVTQIIDDIHFAWQAHLVRLEGDFTCSTHWKWRFICDADHWWHSFCVAGAVFGEVGRWLLLRRAL